jgi:hypothetical protein
MVLVEEQLDWRKLDARRGWRYAASTRVSASFSKPSCLSPL